MVVKQGISCHKSLFGSHRKETETNVGKFIRFCCSDTVNYLPQFSRIYRELINKRTEGLILSMRSQITLDGPNRFSRFFLETSSSFDLQ